MDTSAHNLASLFQQLGLADDEAGIAAFVRAHRPLPATVALEDADFWNSAQSGFIHEAIQDDSDWAEVVDELDAMLRSTNQ